jgi:hypothetical protein
MNERGDLFKGESSTLEKPLDHLRLALLDSLPDSQLNSLLEPLLESLLEIFFHPGIDDVLSHSYLPDDGIDNPFHLLGIGDPIHTGHIVHLRLQYNMGSLSLPLLPQKKTEECLKAIEDVLAGQKRQYDLDIVHPAPDLLVLDPAEVEEREDKVGGYLEKFRRRAEEIGEARRETPGNHPVIDEERESGAGLTPLLQLPDPEATQIMDDLKMSPGIGSAFMLHNHMDRGLLSSEPGRVGARSMQEAPNASPTDSVARGAREAGSRGEENFSGRKALSTFPNRSGRPSVALKKRSCSAIAFIYYIYKIYFMYKTENIRHH